MRLVLAAVASLAIAGSAAAESLDIPSGTYKNDPTHTSVMWKVNHFGFSNYTGMFERGAITATVNLDADDVTQSSLDAGVTGTEVATLDPRGNGFDEEIASDMFINAVQHPSVSFKSTDIEVTGDNTANIHGELTLAGVTLPIVLETTLNAAANHPMAGAPAFGISAVGTFDRTDFGVESLAGPVGTDVTIEIQAEFIKAE